LFRLVLESHNGRAPGADSEEKHEPVSDIDTAVVDGLKALDPEWPIREADIGRDLASVGLSAYDLGRVKTPELAVRVEEYFRNTASLKLLMLQTYG